jgi:hypothetical protein
MLVFPSQSMEEFYTIRLKSNCGPYVLVERLTYVVVEGPAYVLVEKLGCALIEG